MACTLRDFNNADTLRPPSHAISPETFHREFEQRPNGVPGKLRFGPWNGKTIPITYDGSPLTMNMPVRAFVTMHRSSNMYALFITADKKLAQSISIPLFKLMPFVVSDKILRDAFTQEGFRPSTLDAAYTESCGLVVIVPPEEVQSMIRCITPDGQSTSISLGIVYDAVWTIDMSEFRLSVETGKMPKYVLPTRMLCITLCSPTSNYGRFS